MNLIFILYVLHQISLAVGLACSLIVDVFIVLVEKSKHIRHTEKNILNRTLSYSFICALIVFFIQMGYIFFLILTDMSSNYPAKLYGFAALTTLISTCLLFCVASQKYYQVKVLFRYQEKHQHLSNSFITHHKELSYTAILSVILWIALYICYVIV
ncbi:MAG: hypothetical protein V4576_01535 [Patescibacteria group bacterium]